MSDKTGNPWTLLTTDVAASTAITSIVRNGQGSATVTSTAHGRAENDLISIQGNTSVNGKWNGPYRVLSVLSANTFLIGIEQSRSTLGNGGATGNVLSLLHQYMIDVQQMIWDSPTDGDTLLVTDSCGRLVWNPTAFNPSGKAGPLTYMKAWPVNGLVLNTMPSGKLQISV